MLTTRNLDTGLSPQSGIQQASKKSEPRPLDAVMDECSGGTVIQS